MKKIFKTGLTVLMIASMAIGLLTGCGGNTNTPGGDKTPVQNEQQNNQKVEKTINLNDYVQVRYRGRDGEGYVDNNHLGNGPEDTYITISTRELANALSKYTIGLYDVSTLERTLKGSDNHDIDPFFVQSEQSENSLSNGDTVHFTWKVNERGLKLLKEQVPGVNFVWEDFDDVVNGLEGVREFDPFNCEGMEAFIDFTFGEGGRLSGQATMSDWEFLVERVGDGSYGRVEIEVDEMGHTGAWKNGDQIKVTITSSDEYILEEFGVRFTTKTGVITVDWLDEPNN